MAECRRRRAGRTVADHGRDRTGGDLADYIVAGIGDVDISGVVHRHPLRIIQLCARGWAALLQLVRSALPPDVLFPANVVMLPPETSRITKLARSAM